MSSKSAPESLSPNRVIPLEDALSLPATVETPRGEPRGASPRRDNPQSHLEDLKTDKITATDRSGNGEGDPSNETPHGVPRRASLRWQPTGQTAERSGFLQLAL